MTKKEFDEAMYAVVCEFRDKKITSREALEKRKAIQDEYKSQKRKRR